MAGSGPPRGAAHGRLDAVGRPPSQPTRSHYTRTILGASWTRPPRPESMDRRWIQETSRFDLGAHRKPQAGESRSNTPRFKAGDDGGTV